LNGICPAFVHIKDPQSLKKLLHAKEPENAQLSLMQKLIKNGHIKEVNGEVPDCVNDVNL